jgi:hypothetical protein
VVAFLEVGQTMTKQEYDALPIHEKIEAGDTILFYFPGGCAPEHHIKVDNVYETTSMGKPVMMAMEKATMMPCVNRSDIISGKIIHTAIFKKNSYDLDYCKIELKGDFDDGAY